MTALLHMVIVILATCGAFVILYVLLRLPAWSREIVTEERATERSHIEQVLDIGVIEPLFAANGHLIRFSFDSAEILEHPDDCDAGEGCRAVAVIESCRLPELGQMQIQGLYRENDTRTGYTRENDIVTG